MGWTDDNPLEDETLQHSDDSSETDKDKKGESKMADAKEKTVKEKTVKEVFDTLTEEQKNVVYAIIGSALMKARAVRATTRVMVRRTIVCTTALRTTTAALC